MEARGVPHCRTSDTSVRMPPHCNGNSIPAVQVLILTLGMAIGTLDDRSAALADGSGRGPRSAFAEAHRARRLSCGMPTRDVRLVDHWRWGGDQRGRLDTESFDKHGDGARRLVQGLVCLVGVHGAGGRCVLVASVKPSLEAVPSHLQCELSVVPLQVAAITRAWAQPQLWAGWCRGESSWFMPVTLPVRRVSGGSVRAWGSSTTRPRVAGRRPWAAPVAARSGPVVGLGVSPPV